MGSMVSKAMNGGESRAAENIAYVRQMLGELRMVAENEGAEMLCYLIEMAYVEAGDLQMGRRALSIHHRNGNKPTRMPV
ncbi:MAG: hypothetical protein H5U11_06270 [Rhizobium sp.]|uniref:Uncharacterized protein n=2 Tax=Rhizobiaceae TaxID=82115 RepID=A0A376AKI7_9HYPH|nr:hypothetical protein [Rhizobium sp.]SSC68335.1 unnamed protein product [Ciceribacter selenitireducens ATCC BAA-1503]SSC72568.1 unnamed protein product [Ciceribacter naphthalenivorans]